MKSDPDADLLPGEWAVLGLLADGPTHGFAVARMLAPDGELGRVWSLSRPRVYRAVSDLASRGLIGPVGEQASERGPSRMLFAATAAGDEAFRTWLGEPVEHVRDVRSVLLLKLAFLHLRGVPATALLGAQEARLAPTLARHEQALAVASGLDEVILRYRVASTRSVLAFLGDLRTTAEQQDGHRASARQ